MLKKKLRLQIHHFPSKSSNINYLLKAIIHLLKLLKCFLFYLFVIVKTFNEYNFVNLNRIKNNKMTENLTKEKFLEKIFNYTENKDWKFEGTKPALIDFYADWCGPCKMLAPILEELSEEYKDKIDIYKIDTEAEQELAAAFGIRSIPSMLFCPLGEEPQMANGALPKAELERVIADVLKIEK